MAVLPIAEITMDSFKGNNNSILHNLHYSINAILSGCNKCHENCGSGRNKRKSGSYNNADIFQNAYPIINKTYTRMLLEYSIKYIYKSKQSVFSFANFIEPIKFLLITMK